MAAKMYAPEIIQLAAGSDAATVALYGMLAAVAVAVIGVIGQIVVARLTRDAEDDEEPRKKKSARTVSNEHKAWERWLLLQDVDPRKIITGYETYDEVKANL